MENKKKYNFKKYALQSDGILLIAMVMILPFVAFHELDISDRSLWGVHIFVNLFTLSMTGLIAHHSLYFLEIKKDVIIVKNLLFFWFEKTYELKEIDSISRVKKQGGKGAWYGIFIQVKFTDDVKSKSKRFLMDSYNSKFEKDLEEAFEQLNITYNKRI